LSLTHLQVLQFTVEGYGCDDAADPATHELRLSGPKNRVVFLDDLRSRRSHRILHLCSLVGSVYRVGRRR
jgi:hypothetical protein